jgi:preprotein translocase subunit SecG
VHKSTTMVTIIFFIIILIWGQKHN